MSHILAGRNKPSLDIVQKIVKRFPDLGTSWILDDEEVPVANKAVPASEDKGIRYPSARGTKNNPAQSVAMQAREPNVQPDIEHNQRATPASTRAIDKVLIFYTDGTFEEFKRPV
jgi:hypothetical protein